MSEKSSFSTVFEIEPAAGRANVAASFGFLGSANFVVPGFRASVERFGIGLDVVYGEPSAEDWQNGFDLLDLVEFRLAAQPVGRLSAQLDLPPITGGGYLEKVGEQLRGAFAADLGVVSVSALAIIELDEFSLLALMGAELLPPLQLSFGFTLVGVGGIVGINRRIDHEAIGEAMRSGELSRLLFPRDPIAEAPRILDVANRCFPLGEDVVVGPMIKVGWGTPTMISGTLATIFSSGEVKGTLIGRLAVSLPAEVAPIIYLEAIALGEFDQWGVSIDASLVNSRLTGFPIAGDLALRLIAGPDEPLFALSAGGFHPKAVPPEGMAGMKRLSVDLSASPVIKLRAEAYLAITPSSTQFGLRVDMQIGVDGFGIRGHASADAWINYDPFWFELAIDASVSVECAGFDVASVRLRGTLGGPNRWFITANATVEILGFEEDIDLPRIEFGERRNDVRVVRREPLEVLRHAIDELDNWIITAPETSQIVRLVEQRGVRSCHPLGRITFVQDSIPLEAEIALVDGVSLDKPVTLSLVEAGAKQFADFIPDRFFKLEQEQLRSSSGYRKAVGGVELQSGEVVAGPEKICSNGYETKVLQRELLLLPFVVERPDFAGMIAALPLEVIMPPISKPQDPRLTTVIPAAIFTNAAGELLNEIPAWELAG